MNIYTTEYWAHYGAGTTAGVSRAEEARQMVRDLKLRYEPEDDAVEAETRG